MLDPLRSIFLLIFIVGITWESNESASLDSKPVFLHGNATVDFPKQFRRPRSITRKLSMVLHSKCITPPQPENGNWTFQNESLGQANLEVISGTNIIFMCNEGFKLSSNYDDTDIVSCYKNKWSKMVTPSCDKLCEPFFDTEVITYECKNQGQIVPCDKATDYTDMSYKCAPYYEPVLGLGREATCYSGQWGINPQCVPVCGRKSSRAATLIVNGNDTSVQGSYPWVVALYQDKNSNYELICGGSLISFNIVLTAAHCVSDRETGHANLPHYYKVAAGKYYSQYDDERDKDTTVYSDVDDIKTYEKYQGQKGNFQGDIALLKLKSELTPSETVQPVCISSLPELLPKTSGLVTGWGFTTPSERIAEKLQELNLPYIDDKECYDSFEIDFADRFLTTDKLCAGFFNQSKSVCKGDSGGGLVFRNPSYDQRYFVHGVVSLSHAPNHSCNIQRGAIFTKVQNYTIWIRHKIIHWTHEVNMSKKCITPIQPLNGLWTYHDNKLGRANVSVPVNTTIVFTCNDGFQLDLPSEIEPSVRCTDVGEWSVKVMPTCIDRPIPKPTKYCIVPELPSNGRWIYPDGGSNSDIQANMTLDVQTLIAFECDSGFKLSSTNEKQQLALCLPNGEWSISELPYCQRICKSLKQDQYITHDCKRLGSSVPCSQATDYTISTYKCAKYSEPFNERVVTSICIDGEWDHSPTCIPVCGDKKDSTVHPAINGTEEGRYYYPWVVGIYSNFGNESEYTYTCQGTLLSDTVILTAAHCVSKNEDGSVYPPNYFQVGAGKYFKNYKDERDEDTAQYLEVKFIKTHPEYKGLLQNFQGDIALLKTPSPFNFSETIQPICIDNLPPLKPADIGVVASWGYATESGNSSGQLEQLNLPYNGKEECFEQLDSDFARRYFTDEKMCAGYYKNSTGICKGDGGAGLVFKNPSFKNRYFVHGILSIAPTDVKNEGENCNSQQVALFTKIEYYMDWIKTNMGMWQIKKPPQKVPSYCRKLFGYTRMVRHIIQVVYPCPAGYVRVRG